MSETDTISILEPGLPIIDPHHHLWMHSVDLLRGLENSPGIMLPALGAAYGREPRYLIDEFQADLASGHRIIATVHNDAQTMYRQDGAAYLRSVGEIEFIAGVAAMSASGLFGPTRMCAAMVGGVDLGQGAAIAEEVLNAHIAASGGRYRGVRTSSLYDDDPNILGMPGQSGLLLDAKFREGFALLATLNLSFDAILLEPQLPDLTSLARAFPSTQIVLNHVGCPLGIGSYAGRREERFPIWRANMQELATCENVVVKLGGIGNPFAGFPSFLAAEPAPLDQLVAEWEPYIATSIELFGADRCMFGSNYPVDASVGSYATIWNVFKRIARAASADEKRSLFGTTAARVYRLEIDLPN